MNDGEHYTVLESSREIVRYEYKTGEVQDTIFSTDRIEPEEISSLTDYRFNEDETVLLITTEQNSIYRHSFSSDYYVYLLNEGRLIPVFTRGEQQLAAISPDGKKVSFIYENNLYIKDLKSSNISAITTDGAVNSIINGMPDWVYEEEFALKTGYYWSPDSRKIAYYRFDESKVMEFNMTLYEGLYPEWYRYKYPKAGENNARVDIYVYDLTTGTAKIMETGQDTDRYIPRIKWLPNSNEICLIELNRLQNEAKIRIADVFSGKSRVFYTETNEKYISEYMDDFVTFFDKGQKALIMSEKDGYKHLYQYRVDGTMINQVTKGRWAVDKLYGFDESNGIVYFSSTEVSPLERHVYSVQLNGDKKVRITEKRGMNILQFSSGFNYYILTHSDANSPFEYSLHGKDDELIRILEDNSELKDLMKINDFVKKEFFSFQPEHGIFLNGYQIVPPDFNKRRKYPVLVYVYGGPESQLVLDKWDYMMAWFQLLARKGYIIVCVDNRGTDGRGEDFSKSTYMQLGKLETEDQIALAEYLANQSFVDKKRIGIFGWSYGGTMSLLCLLKGNHIFKMGIAVAPITNWRYYDTIYTERFMRTPQENPEGYDENSPVQFVKNLEGNLLLIHGMADDNVHFQNSIMIVNKLIESDKQFDVQFYPNKNHGIYGGNTTYHLYKRMTDYIINAL
ncbi:Dipeptidyl aminopeptidase 4 [subsurface metagenome]